MNKTLIGIYDNAYRKDLELLTVFVGISGVEFKPGYDRSGNPRPDMFALFMDEGQEHKNKLLLQAEVELKCQISQKLKERGYTQEEISKIRSVKGLYLGLLEGGDNHGL